MRQRSGRIVVDDAQARQPRDLGCCADGPAMVLGEEGRHGHSDVAEALLTNRRPSPKQSPNQTCTLPGRESLHYCFPAK